MNAQAPFDVHVAQRAFDAAPSALGLYRQLGDAGRRMHTALLESAEPGSRHTQRSLLVASAAASITCRGSDVAIDALNDNGRALLPVLRDRLAWFEPHESPRGLRLRVAHHAHGGSDRERLLRPSVLSVLRSIAQELRAPPDAPPEAVFLAGVFGYELAAQFEDLPATAAAAAFPDYVFLLADELIVIDHLARRTRVLAMRFGKDADADDARAACERTAAQVLSCDAKAHPSPIAASASVRGGDAGADRAARPVASSSPVPVEVDCDRDDAAFCADVAELQRHVAAGDAFQVVASRTFSLACRDALAAYAALRTLNPSPYLFFLHADDGAGRDFVLFGASPESSIKVDAHARRVEISPIAGTRPRGLRADGRIDPDLDSRHEADLRLDVKENAEHMMLVDLARNDIARIARPGTREVADLLRVVRYSHVMHLASRVTGILDDGLDALHACQACFNMGTLTGAPKIRAMQLLREVEKAPRGHYGGAIGYLDGEGNLDTAIVIRAALVRGGIAEVRAGAGVVQDSVPILEAHETRRKAEAVLRAIAIANGATREAAIAIAEGREARHVA
jgi:anthranilate synthase component 1